MKYHVEITYYSVILSLLGAFLIFINCFSPSPHLFTSGITILVISFIALLACAIADIIALPKSP